MAEHEPQDLLLVVFFMVKMKILQSKQCLECNRTFTQRRVESPSYWAKKKFCNRKCFFKYRDIKYPNWNKTTGRTWFTKDMIKDFWKQGKFSHVIRKGKGRTYYDLPCQFCKQNIHTIIKKQKFCNKVCQGKYYSRERNLAWKGGVRSKDRMERTRFRKQIQKQVFERDKYTCQLCGSKQNLQVDHIQSWAEYVELRFSLENCRTLCMNCHYEVTFGRPIPQTISNWGHGFLKGGN